MALWGRYRENVIKVAMIVALTRDDVIRHEDIDFAEAIVGPSVRYMESLSIDHMSDSQHEADCQEVLRHLRAHGGEMRHTELYRLCRRLDSKQLAGVVTSLLEQDKIEIDAVATGERGPKSRVVRLVG